MSDINRLNKNRWETIADFWDSKTENGNDFHNLLVAPVTRKLLALQPGETVLEIACGTGLFAREMADTGAKVVAFDICERFLELAQERSASYQNIEYHHIDATDETSIKVLGKNRFDAAVCNMALMDIPQLEPLMQALKFILKPRARFIFTVMHPCFNSTGVDLVLEQGIRNEKLVTIKAVKIFEYISESQREQVGILGQDVPHFLFHRPISKLLKPAFEVGFVIDALEEVTEIYSDKEKNIFSWEHFPEIPPLLAVRMGFV